MRETTNRNHLLRRIPMAADLLVGELIYLAAGELFILIAFLTGLTGPYPVSFAVGFIIGGLLAVWMMLHMAMSIEDSLTLNENGALRHTRKRYAVRVVVLIIVFTAMFFSGIGSLPAALLGLMSLKAAAYMQPLSHRLVAGFT